MEMNLKYLGWWTGLTYQAVKKEGLDKNYLLRLLDEMKENNMNILTIYLESLGYYDSLHEGITWPVKNKKLECNMDSACLNANQDTEFLSEIIEVAKGYDIQIQFFLVV